MNTFTVMQFTQSVASRSAELAANDPYGIIITVVSVMVVFAVLFLLFISYLLIGKLASYGESSFSKFRHKDKLSRDQVADHEVQAAISMALHQYLSENVHDDESYVITIKRKQS